jgi:hypothetical protein
MNIRFKPGNDTTRPSLRVACCATGARGGGYRSSTWRSTLASRHAT